MSKLNGWIKLYRDIRQHWLWERKPFSPGQAWVDLILRADFADKTIPFGNQFMEIERGEVVTSEKKLMAAWGWSKTKVRAFLFTLEKDSMCVTKRDKKKTTIKILNYSVYQESETTEEPQKDHKKTTKRPQKDTNKKEKNIKNEKEEKINIGEYSPVVKFLVEEYFKTLTENQQKRFEKNRTEYWDCCDKLLRLDGFKEEEIRKAINWARHDSFWSQNFLSFSKLRLANKEGTKYCDVFLEKALKVNRVSKSGRESIGYNSPGNPDVKTEEERREYENRPDVIDLMEAEEKKNA